MNAGRVTRSAIDVGSWQSTQATGNFTCPRASAYGILFSASKPLNRSPPPAFRYGS